MKPSLLAALALLATLGIAHASGEEWKAPARAAKKKNPVAVDARSLASGKAIYERECASCHGSRGKGDGPAAKDLERPAGDLTDKNHLGAQTDGELFWKLTEGNKPMPSYEQSLSEQERWDVVNFTRTLSSGGGKS